MDEEYNMNRNHSDNQEYRSDSQDRQDGTADHYNSYDRSSQGSSWENSGYSGGSRTGRPKKSGVGRIVAITLGLVLLAGVAAAGGYSAREIFSKLSRDSDPVQTEQAGNEQEVKETIASNPTVILNQGTTGSIILTDVSDVVENVMPSVVSVTNTELYTSSGFGFWQFSQEYYADSCGSGIIVGQNDEELLIVTNNHVIENNVSLTVQFVDETTAEATVKGADASNDIAVLAVRLDALTDETRDAIRIATLGDSDELKIGQGVIAIGNALGYGQSVTEGIVSALHRDITTDEGTTLSVLQTSAAINRGNSGGALLNIRGEVIGINVAKAINNNAEGMGYAIPISEVKDLMEEMMTWETREKVSDKEAGYLGVQPLTVDSQSVANYGMPTGVYAYSVEEGSPAAKAGMLEKDIIVALDRYTIRDKSDLQDAMSYFKGGDTVTVTVARLIDGSYQEIDLTVTLGYKSDYVN